MDAERENIDLSLHQSRAFAWPTKSIGLYPVLPGSIHHLLTWEWNQDSYYERSVERATLVCAQKLAFWRKYPIFYSSFPLQFLSGLWFEISALAAYKTFKNRRKFVERVLKEFGCIKVFV